MRPKRNDFPVELPDGGLAWHDVQTLAKLVGCGKESGPVGRRISGVRYQYQVSGIRYQISGIGIR